MEPTDAIHKGWQWTLAAAAGTTATWTFNQFLGVCVSIATIIAAILAARASLANRRAARAQEELAYQQQRLAKIKADAAVCLACMDDNQRPINCPHMHDRPEHRPRNCPKNDE